ncbi:mucolipin-3-like [Erythrolamprus reginae]|uniref:mucolipin-3-like n=1 Tax=Erythrolamprus reginae TaxID=121349 RepID=UPI00396CB785
MENPEVLVGSCSTQDDEHLYSVKHHASMCQLLEDQLRRKLKFFFMNPCEKFWARGRKPWKLGIQILKIAMVTIQLVVFGLSNQMVVTFKEENTVSFKHLFLKGYMDSMDDTYAVYTQKEVYDQISFAINQFLQLRANSVGNHAYEKKGSEETPMAICQYFYKRGIISPGNDTFDIDPEIETECLYVEPMLPLENGTLRKTPFNFTLDFQRLVTLTLTFKLKAINLQTVRQHELPDCYDFTLTVSTEVESLKLSELGWLCADKLGSNPINRPGVSSMPPNPTWQDVGPQNAGVRPPLPNRLQAIPNVPQQVNARNCSQVITPHV